MVGGGTGGCAVSLLDNLPHLATAKRRLRTSDGMGGYVDTYPTALFSGRACWRMSATNQEVQWWQQRGQEVTERVYFAAEPEFGVEPSEEAGVVLEIDGARFDVVSTVHPDASAGLGALWKVMARWIGRA